MFNITKVVFLFLVGTKHITNVHCKDDVQETVIIDMTNFDDENPPLEGVRIPTKDISEAKSFCVRYYVESLKNQGIFTTPKGEMGLGMGLGLARPSPNWPGPIYQLGPSLAQAQRWPKGTWPKSALGRIFVAQAQPKKMLGQTSRPKWPNNGPNDTI